MKQSSVDWRGPAVIGSLLIVYLASVAVPVLLSRQPAGPDTSWSGFYTLLMPRGDGAAAVPAELAEAGFDGVLARSTVTVAISNFSGLERVPLTGLDDRLAEMDPRWDPFLRQLPALFRAGLDGEYEVFYLASSEPLSTVRRRVAAALDDVHGVDGWELAESESDLRVVYLSAFAVIGLLLTFWARRPRIAVFLAALPWIGTVAQSDAGTFVSAALIYFAWALFADAGRRYLDHRLQYGRWEAGRRELRATLLVLAATWALVLSAHPALSSRGLAPILISSAGLAALTGLAVMSSVRKRRRQDHRLFVPVSIRPTPPVVSAASRFGPAAVWVAAVVVAAPYIADLLPRSEVAAAPRPAPLESHETLSFDALHALKAAGATEVVDIADYVAHRAYQEGFVYGAEYGLPEEGSTLAISHFREEEGRTVRERDVVLRYDAGWLDSVIDGAASAGVAAAGGPRIGALLANGNRPAGVVKSRRAGVYSSGTHPARYSLQALLAFLPFLALTVRVLLVFRSGAPVPVLRRKRQAA